jgi:putative ABC transport system ATP-binding protein
MRLFRTLNDEQGITVILITHEPDMAVFAKRVITFRDGRLVEDRRQES